jgi:SAM-dependent methyltransferase
MGFISANIIPIIEEHGKRPYSGRLLLLGQADVYFSQRRLEGMARTARVALTPGVPVRFSHAPAFAAKGYISGETLFRQLGFTALSVMDVSAFEGADLLFDLNSPETPPHLLEQFDVIIDHGTLEHVFHVPNALRNLFRMLRTGGRMIHSAPSGNFFDHGFYMFQPTLFLDFYSANHWEINAVKVAQFTPRQETEPAFFTDYEPGLFQAVSYGGMDDKLYATIAIATKTEASSWDVVPVQGAYARLAGWSEGAPAGKPGSRSLLRRLLERGGM